MKIELGKDYITRSGNKVRIYSVDAGGSKPIHGAYQDGIGDWFIVHWDVDGCYTHILDETNVDIVGEWVAPLDFDWDLLPKWADRYVAMESSRHWYSYRSAPKLGRFTWNGTSVNESVYLPSPYCPNNYEGKWQDSLFMNPKYREE